jgi:hypothetical protein
MMKIILLLLSLNFMVLAHEGGHGPVIKDAPKQGGIVAPVVLAKDAKLGEKALMKHKAEIVRTQDGLVRIYFYDKAMIPMKAGALAAKASAMIVTHKKGKFTEQKFDLVWKDDHFEALLPRPARKPYNIDVHVMEGTQELLVAFDKLD